jgi:hypothetical protein
MSKYITFKLAKKQNPKTKVYNVISVSDGDPIGQIKWYSPWSQYCFFPDEDSRWSANCMDAIIVFIRELMLSRRIKK